MKTLEKQLKSYQRTGQRIVVPYILAGDNGLEQLEQQLLMIEETGVAAIEIGIPFSDPVADGPVIQVAGLRALQAGVTLPKIITQLSQSQVKIPLVMMSYFNPILRYGLAKFVADLHETPVKGLIIPDLPYEHQELLTPLLATTDIALIPLVSLTSSKERIRQIAQKAEGFIYAVTVNGITGGKSGLDSELKEHFSVIKSVSPVPVLAGFGITNLSQIAQFVEVCDGVIIGSKLVQLLADHKETEMVSFLKAATRVPRTSN